MINEKMTDEDWKNLILNLKSDFARIAKAKSEMLRTFEKFFVFQNKFVTIAGLCADMHASIADILKDFATIQSHEKLPKVTSKGSTKRYTKEVEKISKRASELYGDCLKLRLMTPVMAEAFINMVILVFCKDEVRNDSDRYTAFIRSNIPQRIASLSENCFGFTKEIAQTTKIYGDFKRVMDKRNFAIHGNVDPVKEQIRNGLL
ncbi:hypothetical protein LP421_26945 [Rhizobium sp. RCAM05350]|nr:hypothetical protein LP421_26945 [Rhizobium sp. RCAM05350]